MGGIDRAVGIEKLAIYSPSLVVDFADVAEARGQDWAETRERLLVSERGVNPPWEDPVTMAVNAARRCMEGVDPDSIGLLLVGTETSVDQEKPISSWVHHFLSLPSSCRNLEIKHACYSTTGGLQLALAWLLSPMARGKKLLLVSTDHSLLGLEKPWEMVTGSGAIAALVSTEPRLIRYELGKSGVYAHEVSDVIRPTMREETGNSEVSLYSYIEAVDGAYDAYEEVVGEDIDYDQYFQHNIYHTPFGGIAYRAHRMLATRSPAVGRHDVDAHFEARVAPALSFCRRIGTTYGGTTFVGLQGLLETSSAVSPGDRIGIYAYGSGSCAEYYSAVVVDGAQERARQHRLGRELDARRKLSVADYEACERARDRSIGQQVFVPDRELVPGWFHEHYEGNGLLVLDGVEDYVRSYRWS